MQGLPEIGDVLDDTYEITTQLGQGGFGAVYLARQISMDREVALKVLVAHAMKVDEMIQRFRREVMAVRNLSHPNTIRIYDFHDGEDGVLYYSMEYVKGPTLKDIIKEGPISPSRVRHIIRQILKSLSEAHSYGIVHRDLKPANIMLAEMHGEDDFVKVLDFGIAKIMDQNDGGEEAEALTSAGVLVGTLRYMAPEQIAGGDIGPQSDLYALGLIGVEMLTGRSVFEGTGRWEVLHKQISDDPVEIPDSIRNSGMYEFFQRALAKPTQDRFINADEMLKAIDALGNLAGSPVTAGGAGAATADSPISQSGPNSGLGQPVTNPRQQVGSGLQTGNQVPVQVGAGGAAGAAGDEATEFHTLPSESGSAVAAGAGAMQMNQAHPQQPMRQPMHTPIPRQGAAFQTAPPQGFGGHAQASASTTGSFGAVEKEGNGKLIAIAAVLLLLVGGGAIAAAYVGGVFGGSEADAAVAGADAGTSTTANNDLAVVETTATAETTADTETIEPKWVRIESGDVKAEVFAGSELIGTTPVRFAVKDSQILTIKADGFSDKEIAVGLDSEDVVPVELAALVKEEPKEEPKEEVKKEEPKKTNTRPKKDTKKKDDKKKDDGWLDVPTKPKPKDDVPIF